MTTLSDLVVDRLIKEVDENQPFADLEIEVKLKNKNYLIVLEGEINSTTYYEEETNSWGYATYGADIFVQELYVEHPITGELEPLPTEELQREINKIINSMQYAS